MRFVNRLFVRQSLVVVLLMAFLAPTVALAQGSPDNACAAGKQAAKEQHSATMYAVAGALCGIIGFGAALISDPGVPSENLVGKDADYAKAYSTCYKKEAKKKNMTSSCGGWAIGAAVTLVIMSASSSS